MIESSDGSCAKWQSSTGRAGLLPPSFSPSVGQQYAITSPFW